MRADIKKEAAMGSLRVPLSGAVHARELEQERENGSIFHGEPSFAALPHLPAQGKGDEIAE